MKEKKLCLFNILLILLFLLYSSTNFLEIQDFHKNNDQSSTLLYDLPHPMSKIQYNESGQIVINGNSGFESSGYPGNGSISNPYVIEGYNITVSSPMGTLIFINSVTKHFIIRNCFFSGADRGVVLSTCSNGTIYNNTLIDQNQHGIYLEYSSNNTVSFNRINNTGNAGIYFYGSTSLPLSSSNIAYNNTIQTADEGIKFWANHFGYIYNNTIINASNIGIVIQYSENSTFIQNHIAEGRTGFQININSSNTIFEENLVHNCSSNGLEFPTSLSNNNSIRKNRIYACMNGIYNTNAGKNVYSNNIIYDMQSLGIYVSNSHNSTYINNTVYSSGTGLFFTNSGQNNITGNSIYDNDNNGIQMMNPSTKGNRVINNTLKNNSKGITFIDSDFNYCANNLIFRNTGYGVTINSQSNNNTLLANDIIENNIQADDLGFNNSFQSNFWSDHESTDPYLISGSAANQDPSPSITAYILPHVVSQPIVIYPNGGEIVNGSIIIHWTPVTDSWKHPIYYDVFYTLGGITGWTPAIGGTDLTQTTLNWSTTSVNYAFYVKIRVVAKDMMGVTIEDESDTDFDIININQDVSTPTLISPNGGETLTGIKNITWTISDSTLGYTVLYTVSYSSDGGSSWVNLLVGPTVTFYEWDTSTVTDGSNYLVRVTASDGHGVVVEDQSNNVFGIDNSAPTSTTTTTTTALTESSTTTSGDAPGFTLWIVLLILPIVVIRKGRKK